MGRNALYRMNSGVAYIHELEQRETAGGKPFFVLLVGKKYFFEELSIAIDDYEAAKSETALLTKRIRILRREDVSVDQIVRIGGVQHEIYSVRHTFNREGVPVTDITLKARKGEDYDTARI